MGILQKARAERVSAVRQIILKLKENNTEITKIVKKEVIMNVMRMFSVNLRTATEYFDVANY